MSIAVVGSGPAGFAVLTALLDSGTSEPITLFDIDRPIHRPEFTGAADSDLVAAYYDSIYREIWRGRARAFPPPKTHFGSALPRFDSGLFRSDSIGGLSNFWGGTLLPFTDAELSGWPITRKDLDPHYRRMADAVGISGRADSLNRYFGEDFTNRPPIHLPPPVAEFERSINSARSGGEFELLPGVNRCAVETRAEEPDSCVRCGECLAGCFRGSIFSTRPAVSRWVAEGRVRLVSGEVRSVDPSTRQVTIGSEMLGPFDRIFLAAGCPNTTAIVLRSFGLRECEPMADHAVFVFPILHFGGREAADDGEHVGLTNLLVALAPRRAGLDFAQLQVYPNTDYFWRYNLPPAVWPLARRLVSWSRGRLFWARLYVHGRRSHTYSVQMRGDDVRFGDGRPPDQSAADAPMRAIREAFNRDGFWVPPVPPLLQRSNSHYAGTLPMGGSHIAVDESGQVAPGIFLCDSSVFPALPAVSPTFTLMANAHRIASADSPCGSGG